MERGYYIAVIVILLGIITYLLLNKKESQPIQTTVEVVKYKRDSVLLTINDTIVETIEKEHEKVVNKLLTLPPDSQCVIFSNYLSENAWRLSGGNNK